MTPREARRQRRQAERKASKSAKGADARRQTTEELAPSLGGALESAPVLRVSPQPTRKAEAVAASHEQATTPEPVSAPEPISRAEINRQNSLHSTGPRTPEGKLASSRNSFKHGLYSKALVLPCEDPSELDALKADLRAEHQPADTTEEILVNELAEQYWRLRRMRRYEAEALVGETKYENWFSLMTLIGRTMASAERGFHKSLTALRQLQKARGFVPQVTNAEPADRGFVPQKADSPFPESSTEPDFPTEEEPSYADRFAELEELEAILAAHRAA